MAKYQVHSINEFKDRAIENNITLEDKRFFVGTDCHEPRCFGIFQDEITDEWVVYKNKSDGTRIERYRGHSEAEACQILWDKLEEEINMRLHRYGGSLGPGGSGPYARTTSGETIPRGADMPPAQRDGSKKSALLIIIIFALIAGLSGGLFSFLRGKVRTTTYRDSNTYNSYDSTYDYNSYDNYDSYDSYDYYNDYDYYNNYNSYDSYDYNDYNSYDSYDFNDYNSYDSYDYNDYNSYDSYDSYDYDWDSGSDWDSWDSWDSDWDSDW